jgi:predicted nucleic acid-binding protein
MIYCDTSFVVPLILPETTSGRVERILISERTEALAISLWTRVEVSSVLARGVRMRKLSRQAALLAETQFDAIVLETFVALLPSHNDFELARQYLQHYETGLQSGDALHLAIASNNGAQAIYSLDKKIVEAGPRLGLPVRTITARA